MNSLGVNAANVDEQGASTPGVTTRMVISPCDGEGHVETTFFL
jgi:hypothetical protein